MKAAAPLAGKGIVLKIDDRDYRRREPATPAASNLEDSLIDKAWRFARPGTCTVPPSIPEVVNQTSPSPSLFQTLTITTTHTHSTRVQPTPQTAKMQGFNMGRYYPPSTDHAPTFNSTPSSKKTIHPPTIRFELPYAVWCLSCPPPPAIVGQGVRFNAVKTRIGNYHSTPIWEFKMKHTACGGEWVIKTDPKTATYVVVSGARKRDYGDDAEGGREVEEEGVGGDLEGMGARGFGVRDEGEREKRREDAFASFEGRVGDKALSSTRRERVEELLGAAEVWRDDWSANDRLRRTFRGVRKEAEREEGVKEGLKERFGLELEVLAESEADRVRAGLVGFGADEGEGGWEGGKRAERKPLFETGRIGGQASKTKTGKSSKAEMKAEDRRNQLQQTLLQNTRAAINPFHPTTTTIATSTKPDLGIMKRKRVTTAAPTTTTTESPAPPPKKKPAIALVGYDSD